LKVFRWDDDIVVMLVNIYVLEDNAKNLGRELEKLIVEGR
jgi:hypothetical protein